MRHLWEFYHAVCPWRCVVRTGCPQIADLVEIVVSANHRPHPGLDEPVRFLQWCPDFRKFGFGKLRVGFGIRRLSADIAGHDERAARRAKPGIGGVNHLELLNHPLVYDQILAWLTLR